MIDVRRFVCNMLEENCYVASDETNECVIIDCGAITKDEFDKIHTYIRKKNLTPKRLISTHGHLDHNFGNKEMFDKYGLVAEVMKEDNFLMNSMKQQYQKYFSVPYTEEIPEYKNIETDKITFGNSEISIIRTPGHTPGSVVLWLKNEKIAFTGDTLFLNSIGRVDLEGGNMMQMIQSLRTLAQLPDETVILPGHGPRTNMAQELQNNPYFER